MNNEIILSIVVTTKDRYEYLKYFIKNTMRFEGRNWELIVQDNTEANTEIIQFLNHINDNRIKYYHISEPIPISTNADIAVSHANGKYISFMGDDDIISPHIMKLAEYMDKNYIDAAIFNRAWYIWPGVSFYHKFPSVRIPSFTGKMIDLDVRRERELVLAGKKAGLGYLPVSYQALTRKECMDKVREHSGSYFPGASPDISGGIAASYFVHKFIYVDAPFISSGQSPKSVVGTKGRHQVKKIEDVPFLPKNEIDNWDSRIPKIWCSTTTYTQSLIDALKSMGKDEEIKKINFNRRLGDFICLHHNYLPLAIETIQEKKRIPSIIYYAALSFVKRTHIYIKNSFMKKNYGLESAYNGINNSMDASVLIDKSIKERGIRFK